MIALLTHPFILLSLFLLLVVAPLAAHFMEGAYRD